MRVNPVKYGAMMSYVSYALSMVLNLIATPIMLRSFGENEYGIYQLVMPLTSMLNVLTFGLGSVYTRYYSIYKTQQDTVRMARLNGMFIAIYSGIGILSMMIGGVFALCFEQLFPDVSPSMIPLGKTLTLLMTANMAVSFPIYVFTSHIIVNEAYVYQKTIAALKMVINPILTVILMWMGLRSVAVAVLTLALSVAVGVADMIYCFKRLHMPVQWGMPEKGVLKEMLGFTFFVFISNLVAEVNWNSDRIVLGAFGGAQSEVLVGAYSLGAQINIYFMSLGAMLTNLFVPRVHRLIAGGRPDREVSDLFIKVGRWQFILSSVIVIGFIAVGRGFMVFYSGGEYDPTLVYVIALMLMIPGMVPSMQSLATEIQQAKNKHRFRAITYAIVAVVNVALSIPLSMHFGAIGAALGTTFTVVVGKGLLMNWYFQKHIGLDVARFWKEIGRIALPMAAPLAAAIAMAIFADTTNPFVFFLCGGGIVAMEAVALWFFGMNGEDRQQIAGPILRRLKK